MKLFIILFISFISLFVNAQYTDFLIGIDCKILQNEKYGKAERNVFDIIMPASGKPTALIIFIHGGGFAFGDKKDAYEYGKDDIKYYLEKGVAFATISYQFYKTDDSIGIGRCLNDVKTALQYIRHNALKYNIDKEFIGCYGISAGAGSSLYLGFHDDMAFKNDTTLLGESTRIKCAGAIATQATYDLFRWMDYIPNLKFVVSLRKKQFYNSIANFYGYRDYHSFKPMEKIVPQQFDMLRMISADDPPIYVINLKEERFPKNYDIIQHHREHALVLSEYLEKSGVKHFVYVYNDSIKSDKDVNLPIRDFMVNHLK